MSDTGVWNWSWIKKLNYLLSANDKKWEKEVLPIRQTTETFPKITPQAAVAEYVTTLTFRFHLFLSHTIR